MKVGDECIGRRLPIKSVPTYNFYCKIWFQELCCEKNYYQYPFPPAFTTCRLMQFAA